MSEIDTLIQKVEDHYDADLLVYFGPIARAWDDHLIDMCHMKTRRN